MINSLALMKGETMQGGPILELKKNLLEEGAFEMLCCAPLVMQISQVTR